MTRNDISIEITKVLKSYIESDHLREEAEDSIDDILDRFFAILLESIREAISS